MNRLLAWLDKALERMIRQQEEAIAEYRTDCTRAIETSIALTIAFYAHPFSIDSIAVREYQDTTNEDGTIVRQPRGVAYQVCVGYAPLR